MVFLHKYRNYLYYLKQLYSPSSECHQRNKSRRHLHLFASDWKGEDLRGPTDIAFAGPDRDIMLAASLDNLCVHRLDNTGVVGLPLNYPRID